MFQTMNSVRINSFSLKYERFSPTGCKDIGNRTFEFVANSVPLLLNFRFFRHTADAVRLMLRHHEEFEFKVFIYRVSKTNFS